MASQPRDWRIDDIIDFEFFLAADRTRTDAELAARDRAILLGGANAGNGGPQPRRKIRLWLEARRNAALQAGEELPGQLFREAYHFLFLALCMAGLLLGAAVAASHLYYYGDRPINVLVFLAVTVLPQLLLLATVAMGLLARGLFGAFQGIGLLRWLLRAIFLRLIDVREKAAARAHGRTRLQFGALWGIIQSRRTIYGNLWLWPPLVLTQVFAVCFNIGVIAMIVLLVTVSNRAFGWETTLDAGPDAMYHFVKTVALPWSWLPCAHPDLQQVAGSRVFLNGTGTYPTDALTSWWPFLCYVVFFYGLLPRAILLAVARARQTRALTSLAFNHSECNRLLRLMEPFVVAGPAGPKLTPENTTGAMMGHAGSNSCLVIVSTELTMPEVALEQSIRQAGWLPRSFTRAEIDLPEANAALFELLASTDWQGAQPQVVVALDASRPPIKAIRLFLGKLRDTCGASAGITVFLAGTKDAPGEQGAIWRQTVAAMHDPHLSVECGVCA